MKFNRCFTDLKILSYWPIFMFISTMFHSTHSLFSEITEGMIIKMTLPLNKSLETILSQKKPWSKRLCQNNSLKTTFPKIQNTFYLCSTFNKRNCKSQTNFLQNKSSAIESSSKRISLWFNVSNFSKWLNVWKWLSKRLTVSKWLLK